MTDWLTPPNRIKLQHAVGDYHTKTTVDINGVATELLLTHSGNTVVFKPSKPGQHTPCGVWDRNKVLDPLWITTSQLRQ